MIVVDASIWIDHLRRDDPQLVTLLDHARLLMHPFVIGEVALGSIARRNTVIALLLDQPRAPVATDLEVLGMIEREQLFGLGIGYVDAHLLAAARLAGATIWSRDRRLRAAAERLDLAYRAQAS